MPQPCVRRISTKTCETLSKMLHLLGTWYWHLTLTKSQKNESKLNLTCMRPALLTGRPASVLWLSCTYGETLEERPLSV